MNDEDFFTYEVLHPREEPMSDEPTLADRLAAMRDDIRQNALPNKGDEKDQWLRTFDEAVEALREKDDAYK